MGNLTLATIPSLEQGTEQFPFFLPGPKRIPHIPLNSNIIMGSSMPDMSHISATSMFGSKSYPKLPFGTPDSSIDFGHKDIGINHHILDYKNDTTADSSDHVIVEDNQAFFKIQTIGESRLFLTQKAYCQKILPDINENLNNLHSNTVKSFESDTSGFVKYQMSKNDDIDQNVLSYLNTSSSPFPILLKSYKLGLRDSKEFIDCVKNRIIVARSCLYFHMHPNILPTFDIPLKENKLPFISRQFVDRTLLERVLSDPPILPIEKQWLVFQMICSVAQLHSTGMVHGNITTSNFLVTSSDHVFLTDISTPFKPYLLHYDSAFSAATVFFDRPEVTGIFQHKDNPFYFPPERLDLTGMQIGREPYVNIMGDSVGFKEIDQKNHKNNPLTSFNIEDMYAGDIYSLGCCIAEIYCHGQPVLTFRDVFALAQKVSDHDINDTFVFPTDTCNKWITTTRQNIQTKNGRRPWYIPYAISLLDDKRIYKLVCRMCSIYPKDRPSAIDCLKMGQDLLLFPDIFYSLYLPLSTLMLHPFFQSPHLLLPFLFITYLNIINNSSHRLQIKPSKLCLYKMNPKSMTIVDANKHSQQPPKCLGKHIVKRHKRTSQPNPKALYNRQHMIDKSSLHNSSSKLNALIIFQALLDSTVLFPVWHRNGKGHVSCIGREDNIENNVRKNGALIYHDNLPVPSLSLNGNQRLLSTVDSSQSVPIPSTPVSLHSVDASDTTIHNTESSYTVPIVTDALNEPPSKQTTPEIIQCQHNNQLPDNMLNDSKLTESSQVLLSTIHHNERFPHIYKFMSLWKFRRRQLLLSLQKKKKKKKKPHSILTPSIESVPFPCLTNGSGKEWATDMITLWERTFTENLKTATARADIWKLSGNHTGIFLQPCINSVNTTIGNRTKIYASLFNVDDEKQFSNIKHSDFDLDHSICFLNFFLPNCITNFSTQNSSFGLNIIKLLATPTDPPRFSQRTIYERLLPVVLSLIDSPHVQTRAEALELAAILLDLSDWKIIPKTYIPDCLFHPLQQFSIDSNPRCRQAFLTTLPRFLSATSRAFIKLPKTTYDKLRPSLLQFFHGLLISPFSEVRIAVLRSSASLPCLLHLKDLVETILPFLISFLNSSEVTVRLSFCLNTFTLVQYHRDIKHRELLLVSPEKLQTYWNDNDNEHWISREKSYFWTVTSALLPCFGGALEDSDELVVEASLHGLKNFFMSLRYSKISSTESFNNFINCSSSLYRWRQLSRQLTKKVSPLVLHPNKSISMKAIALLKTMHKVWFSEDPLASIVYLSKALLPLAFETPSIPTLQNILSQRRPRITRFSLYYLALANDSYRGSTLNILSDKLALNNNIIASSILLLGYIKQAFKQTQLKSVAGIESLQRLFHPVSRSNITNSILPPELHTSDKLGTALLDSASQLPLPLCFVTSSHAKNRSATILLNQHCKVDSVDNIIDGSSPLYPTNCSILTRSELDLMSSLFHPHSSIDPSLLTQTLDNAIIDGPSGSADKESLKRLIVHWDELFYWYTQNYCCRNGLPFQKPMNFFKSKLTPWTKSLSVTGWAYRDWRSRVLSLPNDVQIASSGKRNFLSDRLRDSGIGVEWTSPRPLMETGISDPDSRQRSNPDKRFVSLPQTAWSKLSTTETPPDSLQRIDPIYAGEKKPTTSLIRESYFPAQSCLIRHDRLNQEPNKPLVRTAAFSQPNLLSFQSHRNPTVTTDISQFTWKPKGCLVGTIYNHETACSTSQCGRTVALETTNDGRLMVSGTIGSIYEENYLNNTDRVCGNSPSKSNCYIWNCRTLGNDPTQSCLRAIEFSTPYIPTVFRVFNNPASILIGTHGGAIAKYRLEASRGGDGLEYLSNTNLSRSPMIGPDCNVSDRSVVALETIHTVLEEVACSIHRNGRVGCWDFRCPKISYRFSLPVCIGQPSCMCVAPTRRSIHVGTLGGYLVTFDLRYRLPVQVLKVTVDDNPVAILASKPSSPLSPTSIFLTLGSERNEVCLVDPLTGHVDWGFLSADGQASTPYSRSPNNHLSFLANKQKTILDEDLKQSQEKSIADSGLCPIPLPKFDIVDPDILYGSRSWSRYANCQTLLTRMEFGSNGNILTLFQPSSVWQNDNHSVNSLDSVLLTGGTDRRARCLSLQKPVQNSYIVIGSHETETTSYTSVPILDASSNLPYSSPTWRFSPIVAIERIHNDAKCATLRSKYLKNVSLNQSTKPHRNSLKPPSSDMPENLLLEPAFLYPLTPGAIQLPRSIQGRSGICGPDAGHRDAITALTVVNQYNFPRTQSGISIEGTPIIDTVGDRSPLLVTGGRDGLIKIWD